MPSRPRWPLWLFLGLPVWLAVSAGFAIWWQLRKGPDSEAAQPERRFTRTVSQAQIANDLLKLRDYLGERNTSSPAAQTSLRRTALWIASSLGPSNTGYQLRQTPSPSGFPLLEVSIPGKTSTSPLWLVVAYDSPPGNSGGDANSGIAILLAVAEEMAADKPSRTVHFLFLPHGNDPSAPIADGVKLAASLIQREGKPNHILCLEPMGISDFLHLSSSDPSALPARETLSHLATVEEFLPANAPLSSSFLQAKLPAVKISAASSTTSPEGIAHTASILVELIRRLSY